MDSVRSGEPPSGWVQNTDMGWLRLAGSMNYRSLLQNIVSFIGLFCKRDIKFDRSYWPKPPHISYMTRGKHKLGNKILCVLLLRATPTCRCLLQSSCYEMLWFSKLLYGSFIWKLIYMKDWKPLVWLHCMKTHLYERLICMSDSFIWMTHLYESLICMNHSYIWMIPFIWMNHLYKRFPRLIHMNDSMLCMRHN